ncbi:uncharacterized protein LOC129787358 [Lutzomyia longipalpis]|uniref:uncharacterized protein LOC129787358 n=1 Tax=Lutzomyia longipalpis TaxID=7200 RepID=UPI002483BC5E|nr:uncharacterized protein LOC129787358 [Lutzomyia longipalpis]
MNEERQEGDEAMKKLPMAAPKVEAPMIAASVVVAPTVAAPAVAAPTVETPAKALPTATINSGSRREKVTGFALGLREIEALVPRFEPGDRKTLSAAAWLDTVSAIFRQYGVRDEHSVLMASMRLKGAAKSWFEGMRGNLYTWEIFGEALKEFFPGEIDNLAIHQKLREGKKRRSETAEEYCYGKMALAQQIQLDFNTLTSYIVAGIQDPNLRSILSTSRYDSLPEIVLTINCHEASQNLDRWSRDHRREDRHSSCRDSRRDERRGEWRDYRRGR